MFTINGQTIPYDRAWTHPETGNHYPANWLRLASAKQKADAGLIETISSSSVHDQRFYWSPTTPKQLNDEAVLDEEGNDTGEVTTGLKTLYKNEQNSIAASLLAPSDWRVVKAMEVSGSYDAAKSALPDSWKTYRAAVRTICNTRQTEIDACSDVDELKELLFGTETITQQKTDSEGNGVVEPDKITDSEGNEVDNPRAGLPVYETIANSNIATAWPDLPA